MLPKEDVLLGGPRICVRENEERDVDKVCDMENLSCKIRLLTNSKAKASLSGKNLFFF